MSARRRIVGPGLAPSISAVTELSPRPRTGVEAEPLELLDDDRLGDGQIRPDLRVTMDPAADRDDVGQERASVGEEGGVVGRGFGRHQDASMRHYRSAACSSHWWSNDRSGR